MIATSASAACLGVDWSVGITSGLDKVVAMLAMMRAVAGVSSGAMSPRSTARSRSVRVTASV